LQKRIKEDVFQKNISTSKTKLKFICKNGHICEDVPNNITQGTWCRRCEAIKRANKNKLTIKLMQDIAQKKNGECLSTNYIDSNTKLLWRCRDRHEWMSTPNNIKKGNWCPICIQIQRKYEEFPHKHNF
jgi:hypothetical protein